MKYMKTLLGDTPTSEVGFTHTHDGVTGGGMVSHTDLGSAGTNTHAQIDTHLASASNPHTVTLTQAETAGGTLASASTPTAIHDDVAGEFGGVAEKTSPATTDRILIEDSAASYAKKYVQVTNLPAGTPVETGFTHTHDGITGGGTIDHADLSSIGTTSHTGIDVHIGSSAAHGVTGYIVGTGGAQTLTVKNLTATSNSFRYSKEWRRDNPAAADDCTVFFTNRDITVTQIRVVRTGGTGIAWTLYHGSSAHSTTNTLVSASSTSTGSGDDITSFTDETIPADSYVTYVQGTTGGSPTEIFFEFYFTEDVP